MEIYFLDKLINFNSTDFENYLKKLDEIKKKLRNDTTEEEDKGDDMNLKDDEDGEGTDAVEKKQIQESQKTISKKKDKNKQNKIQQQRKKKLKVMTKFFRIILILFLIKLILILFSSKSLSPVISIITFPNFGVSISPIFCMSIGSKSPIV